MYCMFTQRKRAASKLPARAGRLAGSLAVPALVGCLLGSAGALEIDHLRVLVSKNNITGGTMGGTIGCYTYDQANDIFYAGIFGSTQGLRKIWKDPGDTTWQTGVYVENGTSSTPSDMLRFIRSSDVPGGQVDADDSGTSTMGGMILNPAPLTIKVQAPGNYDPSMGYGDVDVDGNISINYGPGELAFITDHGSEVKVGGSSSQRRFNWTKKVYRWDLREVGAPTSIQPDYDTGLSGGKPEPPDTSPWGAYNQADWNDVLAPVMTEEAMRDAYVAAGEPNGSLGSKSNDNFGRQFTWSTDGQSVYCIDSGSKGGGLYKVSATDGTVELIYAEPDFGTGSNVIGEPAVMHTSVRDFGVGFGDGDQVLFDGSGWSDWTKVGDDFIPNPNPGGINYVVDTGTAVSGPRVLLSGDTYRDFAELPEGEGSVRSIATDPHGNVFFYDAGRHSLYRLDPQGRLDSVVSKHQLWEFNETVDGSRSDGGGMLRLQAYQNIPGETGNFVTYRGDNQYIGAVEVFRPGDIDYDGDIDAADTAIFVQASKFDERVFPVQTHYTVLAMSTTNQDLGELAYGSGFTIDGVTLAPYDIVLLNNQTDPAENGIYYYYSSSSKNYDQLKRGTSYKHGYKFDSSGELTAALKFDVAGGTTHAGQTWHMTSGLGGYDMDTDPIGFEQSGAFDLMALLAGLNSPEMYNYYDVIFPTVGQEEERLEYMASDTNGSLFVTYADLEALLQYTWLWYGDLDWNGTVDAADESSLLANLGMENPTWFDGDLDLDGDVDDIDLATLTRELGNVYTIDSGDQWGGFLPSNWAPVPEPNSLLLLTLGAIGMLLCRRRRARIG